MLRLTLVLTTVALGPFRGCGEDPPESRPLPVSDASICRSDADCRADTCEDIRCVGGACVASTSGALDEDADGFGPGIMCGGDCNDRDPGVRPGAFETCDARDEDCDGLVDEDAVSRTVNGEFPGVASSTVIAAWGATTHPFIAVEPTLGGVFGRAIDLFGRARPAVELLRLARGSRYVRVHAIANDEQQVLIVARTDIGAVQYAIFEADEAGRPLAVVDPTFLELDGQAADTDVIYAGSGWLLAADTLPFDESEPRRLVFDDLAGAPRYDEPAPLSEDPEFRELAPLAVGWVPPMGFAVADGEAVVYDSGERVETGGAPMGGLAAVGRDGSLAGYFVARETGRGRLAVVTSAGTVTDLDTVSVDNAPTLARLGDFITIAQETDVRFYDAAAFTILGNIRTMSIDASVATSGANLAAMSASTSGGTSVTILARCE